MGSINLSELAKLRQIEKWKIESLAAHFEVGTTTLKRKLRALKKAEVR